MTSFWSFAHATCSVCGHYCAFAITTLWNFPKKTENSALAKTSGQWHRKCNATITQVLVIGDVQGSSGLGDPAVFAGREERKVKILKICKSKKEGTRSLSSRSTPPSRRCRPLGAGRKNKQVTVFSGVAIVTAVFIGVLALSVYGYANRG